LALGGLDIVEVAVNPHSMLLEPYVNVLADQLKERIAVTPPGGTVFAPNYSSSLEDVEELVSND
jgi:hypothetical protein